MKIWLDDIREAPAAWYWAKTVGEVKWHLLGDFDVTEISLDHDLGEGQPTGYDFIKWLEKEIMTGGVSPSLITIPEIRVHSTNPVGRAMIEAGIKGIRKYLEKP